MFSLDYPFGTCSVERFKPLSRKYRCLETVIYMNNKLNAPFNIQENLTLQYEILLKIRPFLRLSNCFKGDGHVFRSFCHGCAFNCHIF